MKKELKKFKVINNWETKDINGKKVIMKKGDIATVKGIYENRKSKK